MVVFAVASVNNWVDLVEAISARLAKEIVDGTADKISHWVALPIVASHPTSMSLPFFVEVDGAVLVGSLADNAIDRAAGNL